MPFASASRAFFVAALVDLAAAGALLLAGSVGGALAVHWELLLWLLLVGFVGGTTAGFSLHLFPVVARRLPPPAWAGPAAFLLLEAGLLLGAAGLSKEGGRPGSDPLFALGAFLFLLGEATLGAAFLCGLRAPRLTTPGPEPRPADAATLPLLVGAWLAAIGAGGLFLLSASGSGPGFGWWIAAVHLFVLGHAVVLIAAVALRLLPRSANVDVPRPVALLLAGLALTGATAVPTGMLAASRLPVDGLDLLAAPEAAFAALFVAVLGGLALRARARRAETGLYLASGTLLLVAGAIGLAMAAGSVRFLVESHAFLGLLGFVGLTILATWFGLIAPFQRISHAWTRRMLGLLTGVWILGVGVAAAAGDPGSSATGGLGPWAGALLLAVAVAWLAGTAPVLYPRLNPLPGWTSEEIRALRQRGRDR